MGRPTHPPPPLLEPGWYPDPTARFEARYWDGRHWTSHISHYGATGTDPLLRARFDVPWLHWLGRLVLWGALFGVGWWAYQTYWPTDERDLDAEAGVVDGSVLVGSDVPEGYSPAGRAPLSPIWLDRAAGDDDGGGDDAASNLPEECGVVLDEVDLDSSDPQATSGFDNTSDGFIVNAAFVAADVESATGYLEALRSETAGACLAKLWSDAVSSPTTTVEGVAARAMVDPSFGEDAVWWRLSGSREGGAFPVAVFADVIVVRSDRVVSEYAFASILDAIRVDVHRDIIGPHMARLGIALSRLDVADEADDDAVDGE